MTLKHGTIGTIWALSTILFVVFSWSCGEDPTNLRDETLNFETPISAKKIKQETNDELKLRDSESSNFHLRRIGAYVPWDPYPIWPYFQDPVPYPIPVAPGLDLIDYVHPFYAYASFFYPWVDDDI